MTGRAWKRWPASGVATDRTNYGDGWVMWRVYVADPDPEDVMAKPRTGRWCIEQPNHGSVTAWRETGVFISSDRHARPEWRYSVNIAGGDMSGGALTVARKRLLADAIAAAARQAVKLEKQRAQHALGAAVLAWRADPTPKTEAANKAAAERYMHWSRVAIGFECIDQQNGAA